MVGANSIIGLLSFVILTMLWVGILAAIFYQPELLDNVWQWFRAQSIFVQVAIGLLILPVALGLWIWELSWPFWLRLVLILGLAIATTYVFFPRSL